MNTYFFKSKSNDDRIPPSVIALGNFDGVHLGHAKLLKTAAQKAREIGGDTVSGAFTFTYPPRSVLDPSAPPVLQLTSLEDKLSLFKDIGIDCAFTEDFFKIKDFSPEEFIDKILCQSLNIKCAVCGFNFRFGKGGRGDSEILEKSLKKRGIETIVIPPVIKSGKIISSSAIRTMIADGDTEGAAELLGHPFFIKFPVVYGKQLGRTIGIPTINQNFPENYIIPKRGIYACTCTVGDDIFLGVANVGVRPTVSNSGNVNCETHIINYSGMLYGKCIRVDFYRRLRDELKFSDINELKNAIKRDIDSTIQYFSNK